MPPTIRHSAFNSLRMRTIQKDISELSRRLRWRQLETSTREKSGKKELVATRRKATSREIKVKQCMQKNADDEGLRDLIVQLNQNHTAGEETPRP